MPAPNDRDDVLDAFREGRQAIDDFGLRRAYVYLRTRVWYDGVTAPWAPSIAPGRGYPVDTERAVLPSPRTRNLSAQLVLASAGRYRDGDIQVDKITPRGSGNIGIELWELEESVAFNTPGTERHLMILWRSGTPWHLREGTDRLLTPGPYSVATAVTCANALRAAYPGHWSDAYAHAAGSPDPAPGVAATDQASAITLANLLRTAWVAHRADAVMHPAADELPVIAPAATDAQSLLVLLHDLLRVFNAHVAPGDLTECEVVEAQADRAFTLKAIARPTRRTP